LSKEVDKQKKYMENQSRRTPTKSLKREGSEKYILNSSRLNSNTNQ